jgi:hypothetical protein
MAKLNIGQDPGAENWRGLSKYFIPIFDREYHESGGWEIFSSPPHPERFWGPPSLLSNGYQGFVLGVERPGPEADHPPPSVAGVE